MKKRFLILGMAVLLAGCGKKPDSLMSDVKVDGAKTERALSTSETEKMADFGVALLKKGDRKNNELVCPYSLANVLGMAALGADGETKSDIEALIGDAAHMVKSSAEVKNANAIWFNDTIKPKKAFLSDCKKYYEADAYTSDMTEKTVKDINRFVYEHTDKMIPELLKSVPSDSQMILVNVVSFKNEWERPYKEDDILKDKFLNAQGREETGEFLVSEENFYIQGDSCRGFVKPYKDRKQFFVALLPDEDWDLESFIETLSGRAWMNLVQSREEKAVSVTMPKFEVDKKFAAIKALKGLGVQAPFDSKKANFSGITKEHEGIYISKIEHRCLLKVDEKGTEAGAASAAIMEKSARPADEELVLNRPFVYAVIDAETLVPVFIGALRSIH